MRTWCEQRLARWDLPHDTAILSTSLGPTHLTAVGAGDEVCVYLPGTSFNAATSTDLLGTLGATTRVVCADLPGQPGLSAAGRPAS